MKSLDEYIKWVEESTPRLFAVCIIGSAATGILGGLLMKFFV